MIRHIVMWRLKPHAEGLDKPANAMVLKARLESLNGRIPGMRCLEVGLDESLTDQSADVVLYSEFDSWDALAAYQQHPEHEAVKPFVQAVRESRLMVDYTSPRD